MSERKKIEVHVAGGAAWDFMPDWPETTKLAAFRQWLADAEAKIPEEYRSTATIEIDSIGGYEGEHHAEVIIAYWRPETDDEMAERLDREARQRAHQEARERDTLERLKAKYGA